MREKQRERMQIGLVFANYGAAMKLALQIYHSKLGLTLGLYFLGSVFHFLSEVYLLCYIVNALQLGEPTEKIIGFILLTMAASILFRIWSAVYDDLLLPLIDKRCEVRLRKKIYAHSLQQDLADYEDPAAFAQYHRAVNSGADAILRAVHVTCLIVSRVLNIGLTGWLMLAIDPILLVFAVLPLLSGFLRLKSETLYHTQCVHEDEINRRKEYTKRTFYLKDFAKEMRMTRIYRVMLRRFREAVDDYIRLQKTLGVQGAIVGAGIMLLLLGSLIGAEIYALYGALAAQTMLYGDCLIVLNSMGSVSSELEQFFRIYPEIYGIALHITDFLVFTEKKPVVSPNPDGPLPTAGDITLEHVSFRYGADDTDVLRDVNLTIRRGEKIAIVGHNGAGKTTFAKLLMRLYDPTEGQITVGETDIRRCRLAAYRAQYGVVFQDHKQLALTIAENVLGRPYTPADDATVWDALKKAGLADVISTMPHGIHTVVTREMDADGAVLSGGQAQKLAIAAIYARDCATVILDEPSSALDPIAEREMYQAMRDACADRTMIYISHRLSAAVSADRICVFDGGRIKEIGTHRELMALDGIYAELFCMQAEHYVGERGNETV